MHRDNGGSVKACSQKKKEKKKTQRMSAKHKDTARRDPLWSPMLPKEAEGRGCGRILHPSRHKRLTLTFFRASSACLCCIVSICACMYIFTPPEFTSSCSRLFYIRPYSQTFWLLWKRGRSLAWSGVVFPRSVSAGGCHTVFSTASPSEMSCPVRKIAKPSQSRAVCRVWRSVEQAPGACLGHQALTGASAEPGRLPRLVSLTFTQPLSLLFSASAAITVSQWCPFLPWIRQFFNLHFSL